MGNISRREFGRRLATGIVGASIPGISGLALPGLPEGPVVNDRPNFVFLCSDQHSAKYAGFAGHSLVKTPNLDRIARGGVNFSAAYCGSPLCVPSRSSMMTGMYPSDVNSFCNATVYDGTYDTWGKRFRDAGYYCWAVGKQDLNPAFDLGFEDAGVEHGHARKPDITSLFREPVGYRIGEREGIDGEIHEETVVGPTKVKNLTNPERDRRDTDIALRFFRENSPRLKKPWIAFIGLREPHPVWTGLKRYYDDYLSHVKIPDVSISELENLPLPFQAMRNFKRISTPIPEERIRRAIAAYFSMVTELDDRIGEIYRCLEETNQLGNTYFIYTSDHGESLGEHGMWLKSNLYEGPANIPLVISGPGLPTGKQIDTPVGHVDLVTTMLELARIPVPGSLRGVSLSPLLSGRAGQGPLCAYVESHSEGNPTGSCMIRKGDWKLIHFSYYQDVLFNLKDDPEERRNRIEDPAVQDVAADMMLTLRRIVDPEEVTERAFAAQKKVLNTFVREMSEDELFELMRSRLGDGQARVLVRMLKRTGR